MKKIKNNLIVANSVSIEQKIFMIRGEQVMLDRDLAEFYGIETKVLNQSVKRNKERFPADFMFQLTREEKKELVTNCDHLEYLKFSPVLPNVFTEQGVAMLSGVIRSETAVKTSIRIISAFVSMRRFLKNNSQLFFRLDRVEQKQLKHEIETNDKFEKVFDALHRKDFEPKQGIFFDGQIFDAYKFVSGLIRKAVKSIILIDNYIDESVLDLMTKKNKEVMVTILTKKLTKTIILDEIKFNSQYQGLSIKVFDKSHDRFLIIDDKEIYHFGASLKDMGKKWFAFQKFERSDFSLLDILKKLNAE